jgi:hypothetical protein
LDGCAVVHRKELTEMACEVSVDQSGMILIRGESCQ